MIVAAVVAAAVMLPATAEARPIGIVVPTVNPWHLLIVKNRVLDRAQARINRLQRKLRAAQEALSAPSTPSSTPSTPTTTTSSTAASGGARAFLLCVHPYEEPSWSTSAGGLGFVYPPSSYGGIAATLAQTYGESWTNWPEEAQLQVGEMLYNEYGTSPWSTAYHCS